MILKAAVEREKAVQAIDGHREWKNGVVTLWVMSQLGSYANYGSGHTAISCLSEMYLEIFQVRILGR